MPDRDLFRKRVRRGWHRCARLLYSAEPLDAAVGLAVSQTSMELAKGGCGPLNEVIQILQSGMGNSSPRPCEEALLRLEELERRIGGYRTRLLVREAKKYVITPPNGAHALPINIAKDFVVAYAEAAPSPPGLFAEVVESGRISFSAAMTRSRELRRLLQDAPGTTALATQLLADPTGGAIKTQKAPNLKQEMGALVFKPIGVE